MAGLVAAVTLSMATAIDASASCLAAPGDYDPVARARVAFVGTVVSATANEHRALVRVESVWRGPQLPNQVEVESDVQPPPGEYIEDLAIFNPGWRYLSCRRTQASPSSSRAAAGRSSIPSALERYRPGAAHPPLTASGFWDAIQSAWFTVSSNPAAAIAAVLLLATLVTMLLRRRRKGRLSA